MDAETFILGPGCYRDGLRAAGEDGPGGGLAEGAGRGAGVRGRARGGVAEPGGRASGGVSVVSGDQLR